MRGLSQLQLAARAGVSSRTIQFAESGKLLSDSTVRRIADALDVGVDQLLRIDAGGDQDSFSKLPWSISDRFQANQLTELGSFCRDEAEVIDVVRNLRLNFSVQIQKCGSTDEQDIALQRDDELTRSYFRYEQRYLDIWRRNPDCIRVDRVNETLCGVSILLPITRDCFDAFLAGKRGLLDVTAEDLCDQSQTILLDSVTEFVNQSKRPWFRITESLSFITVAQISSLALAPGRDDFEMISFSASPLNERRLTAVGFEAADTVELEFNYPIFLFSESNQRLERKQPEVIERFTIRSTLKHFTHMIKAVTFQSVRRQMIKKLLLMVKRRQLRRSAQSQSSAA